MDTIGSRNTDFMHKSEVLDDMMQYIADIMKPKTI